MNTPTPTPQPTGHCICDYDGRGNMIRVDQYCPKHGKPQPTEARKKYSYQKYDDEHWMILFERVVQIATAPNEKRAQQIIDALEGVEVVKSFVSNPYNHDETCSVRSRHRMNKECDCHLLSLTRQQKD